MGVDSVLRGFLKPGAFRVILAGLVVLSHMSRFDIGRPAVFVFFALSGYWISRMYEEKYRNYASVSVFYLSRFLRIWLSFAAAFALAVAAYAAIGDPPGLDILWGLLLFGIATFGHDPVGTAWSLDLEMQFYLVFPVLWIALARWPRPTLVISAVSILTALGWYLSKSLDIKTMLPFLPSFFIGIAIYRLDWRPSGRVAFAGCVAFALVSILLWATPYFHAFLLKTETNPFEGDLFGQVWIALLIPFIAWNVHQKGGDFDRHLGNYSYVLYIVHVPITIVAGTMFADEGLVFKLGELAAMIIVSTVFYLLIDRRAERLRVRWLKGHIAGLTARNTLKEAPPP